MAVFIGDVSVWHNLFHNTNHIDSHTESLLYVRLHDTLQRPTSAAVLHIDRHILGHRECPL